MIITTNEHFRRRRVSYARKVQVNEEQGFNARMAELKTEWCSKRLELGLPIYTTVTKYEKLKGSSWCRCSEEDYTKWCNIPAFKGQVRKVEVKVNMFNLK